MALRPTTPPYAVSLGNPGEDDHNTIVLGVDVVLPLELDLDGNPLQDDEIRVQSIDGSFERVVCSADDDVEDDPDAGLMFYRFRDLPRAAYAVSVRIGARWSTVIADLMVSAKGITIAGEELTESKPADKMAPAPPDEDEIVIDHVEDDCHCLANRGPLIEDGDG